MSDRLALANNWLYGEGHTREFDVDDVDRYTPTITDQLRDAVLWGRDFLAGAGIEFADASGMGLLKPTLIKHGLDLDLTATPAYTAGRFVGGIGAAVLGVAEMIGGIGMMGGGAAGGAALAIPSFGTVVVPATGVVLAGAAVTGVGARTAGAGVQGAFHAARDFIYFSKSKSVGDRNSVYDFDTNTFPELGVKGVAREDIKKGLQYVNADPSVRTGWNIKKVDMLAEIAKICEEWGLASAKYHSINQGIRHFFKWERMSTTGGMSRDFVKLEGYLGMPAGTFSPNAKGFRAYTDQAWRVVKDWDIMGTSGNTTVYVKRIPGKDQVVLATFVKDGKLQTFHTWDLSDLTKVLSNVVHKGVTN